MGSTRSNPLDISWLFTCACVCARTCMHDQRECFHIYQLIFTLLITTWKQAAWGRDWSPQHSQRFSTVPFISNVYNCVFNKAEHWWMICWISNDSTQRNTILPCLLFSPTPECPIPSALRVAPLLLLARRGTRAACCFQLLLPISRQPLASPGMYPLSGSFCLCPPCQQSCMVKCSRSQSVHHTPEITTVPAGPCAASLPVLCARTPELWSFLFSMKCERWTASKLCTRSPE